MATTEALYVNGMRVISVHPVQSSISKAGQKPIYYTRVEQYLLEDGSVTFGCKVCDFTDDSMMTVRTHVGVAHPTHPRRSHITTRAGDLTIRQLMELVDKAETIRAERDGYRDRAKKAETELAKYESVLGKLRNL
jgi:hypothetical protein